MIRCRPRGICSWNFILEGDGHGAVLEFNWVGEQGSITADGVLLEVRKHGMLSGHWTLNRGGTVVASAQKSNPLTRTFEIEAGGDRLTLCAESAFGRRFRLERWGGVVATARPDHPFTRRATIELLGQELDFTTIAFAFWLVVLTWRRSANSGGGAGAG